MRMRNLVSLAVVILLGFLMASMVLEMPRFGGFENPPINDVYYGYLEKAIPKTGAINVVASILADFRAYDTLGETTILFTGIAAVIGTLIAHSEGKRG